MKSLMRVRPSPAAAIGVVAIFVALTGTGVTAVSQRVPPGSIGPEHLRAGAVTSAKVRNGSLVLPDAAAGRLPAGLRGPSGPEGPRGATGERGARGDEGALLSPRVRSSGRSVPSGGTAENGNYDTRFVGRLCDEGEIAISGGTEFFVGDDHELWTGHLLPSRVQSGKPIGFVSRGGNDTGQEVTYVVHVLCIDG
jgi:hypothetical protein